MIKNLFSIIVPLIMFLLAQTITGIWWAAQLDNKVKNLEQQVKEYDNLSEAVNKLNVQIERVRAEHDFILATIHRAK